MGVPPPPSPTEQAIQEVTGRHWWTSRHENNSTLAHWMATFCKLKQWTPKKAICSLYSRAGALLSVLSPWIYQYSSTCQGQDPSASALYFLLIILINSSYDAFAFFFSKVWACLKRVWWSYVSSKEKIKRFREVKTKVISCFYLLF